jgi:ankyrin repeat protein
MEVTPDGFLKKKKVDGTTVIHDICLMGNIFALLHILSVINIDHEEFIMDDFENNQPLHFAVTSGNVEFVRLFIENISELLKFKTKEDIQDFISCYNINSKTPLYIAFEQKHVEMIKLLLEYGADINEEMISMTTPLHLACMLGNIEIFLYLIHNKAKITINDNGQSPLHLACISGNITIVRILLENFLELNDTEELKGIIKQLNDIDAVPALSCGMHPGLIDYITSVLGHTNWMANVGGAITSHPMGTSAGVRAMNQAVTKNYGVEYESAIKKWGKK